MPTTTRTRRSADFNFCCAHCGTGHTIRVLSDAPRKARIARCKKCKVTRRLLPPGGVATTLTDRERVVLDLTTAGLTASAISEMLGVGRVRVNQLQRAALAKQAVRVRDAGQAA